MHYLFVDTGDIDDRVNNVNRAMREPISDCEDVRRKRNLLLHRVFNGTGYYGSVNTYTDTAIELCERAKRLMSVVDLAGEMYKECEDILKNLFDEFDKCSVAIENKIREDIGLDKINTVDGQRAENIAKIAIGVAVIAVGAVWVGGTALGGFMIKALVSTGCSTICGGIDSLLNGGSFFDGAADGFAFGAISGTFAGVANVGAKALKSSKALQAINLGGKVKALNLGNVSACTLKIGGGVASSLSESGLRYISGERVTSEEVLNDVGQAVLASTVDQAADFGSQKTIDYINKGSKEAMGRAKECFLKATIKMEVNVGAKMMIDSEYRSSFTDPLNDITSIYLEDALCLYFKIDN